MARNEPVERIIRVAKYEAEHYSPRAGFNVLVAALRLAMSGMTPLQQDSVYHALRNDPEEDLIHTCKIIEGNDAEGDR